MSDTRPIGVFDSGVGGLSVLAAIRAELPAEDLLYVADSGHAPYGERPRDFVEDRAAAIAAFLLQQTAKALVVACNTATGIAVDALRARYAIPIVAIEPAVKPAAAQTRTGVVGVLATAHTLSSSRFLKLVDTHASGVQVLIQPCPGLVERVELGDLRGPGTKALVEQYVRPLLMQDADTLVLGCTHYPFLRAAIEEVAGAGVVLVDPALAVARELRRRLSLGELLTHDGQPSTERFWTSGSAPAVERVIRQLWKEDASVQVLPDVASRAATAR